MPIYEFTCNLCKEEFEEIVFGRREVLCPKCKSNNLKKLFSVFAISGSGKPTTSTSSCGSCKPSSKCGSCH